MMRPLINAMLGLCCLLMVGVAVAPPSYAAPPANNNCPVTSLPRPVKNMSQFEVGQCAVYYTGVNYMPWEFTSKLVACIEGTIRQTTLRMMQVVSNEFSWLVAVLSTLVIAFFGVRVAMGERELLKLTATLFIKLAFVVAFMGLLPNIVTWVFGALSQFLMLIVGGYTPWQRIDVFLGNLVGFGPSIVLMNGILGLVGAAAFSSNVGLSMFFFGILAILNLLTFILSLIYTYCLAFLTIGFLLVLMPIMIPLSLFFYTDRYFKKWADIIVAAIMTPILLFAFVWMFLGIFDILIQNIFNILGGNDFRAYWRMNTSLFSWLMPSDPNTNVMMQHLSTAPDLKCVDRTMTPPVQTNINPLANNAFNAGIGRMASLNFGANDVNVVQKLSFAFTTLWIFSSLMKSMVNMIPEIASSIANVTVKISFGGSAVIGKLQGGINTTQSKLQSGASGDVAKSLSSFTEQMSKMIGNRK